MTEIYIPQHTRFKSPGQRKIDQGISRRRAILELLDHGDKDTTTIAVHLGITAPGAIKHLRLLAEKGHIVMVQPMRKLGGGQRGMAPAVWHRVTRQPTAS